MTAALGLVIAYIVVPSIAITILIYIERNDLGNPTWRQLWRHWRARPRRVPLPSVRVVQR